MKTQIIGEYKQLDGWHCARVFTGTKEARQWVNAVNESEGHHHARRYCRVKVGSQRWQAAIDRENEEYLT
jgi:hypothetical protein